MKLLLGDVFDSTIKYDGKKFIWNNVYSKAYSNNFFTQPFNNLEFMNGRYQLNTVFLYNNKESEQMYFSGDIIFNFFDSSKRGKRRIYTEMKKILDIERNNTSDKNKINYLNDIESLLDKCKHRTESKENVSILPSTGSLQLVKQAVGRDRFDTFLWCINEHYNGNSLLFNHCAAAFIPKLESFLNLFTNVYEFCYCIYNLDCDDDKLIDSLVTSGGLPINNSQRVLEFVTLANKFWHRRIEEFQALNII